MNLVIETDLGHDPDDLFAICYLAAAGVNIRAICVSPGDPDQIAIARLVCERLKLDIPIGAAQMGRKKGISSSIHRALLQRYGKPLHAEADVSGIDVVYSIMEDDTREDVEAFVIGPVTSVGTYLGSEWAKDWPFSRTTMQGGFVPYSVYRPQITLDKFEDKAWMPTFNLNADRPNGQRFLSAAMPRQMVGKNVCHTVQFDRKRFARFGKPINAASELFCEAARLYFEGHDSKAFHDPTAAVCHLHPEVGLWMDGKTVKRESGWTTVPGEDKVLVDLDHEVMWSHLENWT